MRREPERAHGHHARLPVARRTNAVEEDLAVAPVRAPPAPAVPLHSPLVLRRPGPWRTKRTVYVLSSDMAAILKPPADGKAAGDGRRPPQADPRHGVTYPRSPANLCVCPAPLSRTPVWPFGMRVGP